MKISRRFFILLGSSSCVITWLCPDSMGSIGTNHWKKNNSELSMYAVIKLKSTDDIYCFSRSLFSFQLNCFDYSYFKLAKNKSVPSLVLSFFLKTTGLPSSRLRYCGKSMLSFKPSLKRYLTITNIIYYQMITNIQK